MATQDKIFQELTKLAESLGQELHYKKTECINNVAVTSKVKLHKREAWIALPNNIWLIWAFNPLSMSNNTMNISGVFLPAQNIDQELELIIRTKDILDKVSLKRKADQVRIDDFRFNSKHIITSNKPDIANLLLSNSERQDTIKDILSTFKNYRIGINADIPSILPAETSHIGIFTRLEWITNGETISGLIEAGTKLQKSFL